MGLGNAAFAKDFKLPSFVAVGSGVAELAGAAMMYKGGDLFAHGVLLLAAVMGGAILTMLRSPMPVACLFPATCTTGLWYVLAAAKQAQPPVFAAAVAAGAVGNLAAQSGKKGGKKAPAKAAGKKK